MKLDLGDVAGLVGLALVCAGVWRLAGWPWAALVVGIPMVVGYVIAEALKVRG